MALEDFTSQEESPGLPRLYKRDTESEASIPVVFVQNGGGGGGGGDASAANQVIANAALGAPADAEATGDGTIIALLKRVRTVLGSLSTSALQGTGNTTLASILAKLTADPSTGALQGTGNTSLASILAKLTSDPSTATLQGTGNTALTAMNAKGPAVVTASAFTRPADINAYTALDAVSNNTTAGSVTPITLAVARANDAPTQIRRLDLMISGATSPWANQTLRAHLFRSTPVTTSGDNALFAVPMAGYLGYIDIYMGPALTDGVQGSGALAVGSEMTVLPASGTVNVFALLQTMSTVTPASASTFTLSAELWRG